MEHDSLIGMELSQAKQLLDSANIRYTVEMFCDRKLHSYDKEIVVRVTDNLGHYHLVVCPIQFGVNQ